MKPIPFAYYVRSLISLLGMALGLSSTSALRAALPLNEWEFQQTLDVDRAGLIRIQLTPDTFNAARADLHDLRLLDPAGQETPYLVEEPLESRTRSRFVSQPPVSQEGNRTLIRLPLPNPAQLRRVQLHSPDTDFLKSVIVDALLTDGSSQRVIDNQVVYRKSGAENLSLDIPSLPASTLELRLALNDARSRSIAVSGVMVFEEERVANTALPMPTRIVAQAEAPGETRLTLDLGAAHLPLRALRLDVEEPVFMRSVDVAVREWTQGELKDRVLGSGSVHRIALENAPRSERLEIPLEGSAPGRELIVTLRNGDSPPLTIRNADILFRPIHLAFVAQKQGTYLLLSGNTQSKRPQYDLGPLAAQLRNAPDVKHSLGVVQKRSEYRPATGLGDIPVFGGPLDPTGWRFRRPVSIPTPGVQRLELPLHALAVTRADRGDIRLVSGDGRQVLYLLDNSGHTKGLTVKAELAPVPGKPKLGRWTIRLPQSGLPISQIRCVSGTPLFDREIRVYESRKADTSGQSTRELGRAHWVITPESTRRQLTINLTLPPSSDVLWIETDNGDNAALELARFEILVPRMELLFQTVEKTSVDLIYGNAQVHPPQYDLALVAPRVLSAVKQTATVSGPDPVSSASVWGHLDATWGFYAVLIVVVAGLLFIVSRLLPKPSA